MANCPGCQYSVDSDFAFCPKCGSTLARTCSACSYLCAPDFSFCPKCGSAVGEQVDNAPTSSRADGRDAHDAPIPYSAPAEHSQVASPEQANTALESERRPVTIVFADLSGFTALSELLDPEEVATLTGRCLQVMADAVTRYEGTVDKFIGDCVMALFGAPRAHEDDPVRAVLAALDIRRLVAELDASLPAILPGLPPDRPPLGAHIGVNTGTVIAGLVGSELASSYTVLGDAVNVAARLEAAAERGEIAVGESTYRLTRHAIDFEPLGPLALKGKTEPIPAFRVLGRRAIPTSSKGLEHHGLQTSFIGREAETARLLDVANNVRNGHAEIVSLVGEAGMGKSRLIHSVLEQVAHLGEGEPPAFIVRRASCSPLGEPAFGLIALLLQSAYGLSDDDAADASMEKLRRGIMTLGCSLEEANQIAPLLAQALGYAAGVESMVDVSPESMKRQIFYAVHRVVELRLQKGPLILVADDTQWADTVSIELLGFLADRFAEYPLLVILAQRPQSEGAAIRSSRVGVTGIRLRRFTPDESRRFLASMLGEPSSLLPRETFKVIEERAAGNPYHIEEIVRTLLDEGFLTRTEHEWALVGQIDQLTIPPTLQGILLTRIDRLSPRLRRATLEASILGTEFARSAYRAVASDASQSDSELDDLQDAEILESGALPSSGQHDERLRFTSGLLQDVAYQNLLQRRRAELHGRVAVALEASWNGPAERVDETIELARHWSRSTEPFRATRYFRIAGDWARSVYANEDAAHYYQQALTTVDESEGAVPGERACDLLEQFGVVVGEAGRRAEALEALERARSIYEDRGEYRATARTLRRSGTLMWEAGDREAATRAFQAALNLLVNDQEHIELAHMYQEMGRLAFRTGDTSTALDWSRRALELVQRLSATSDQDDVSVATALAGINVTLGAVLARDGDTNAARIHAEEGLKIALDHDLAYAAVRAYANLVVICSVVDASKAVEYGLAGLALAKRSGTLSLQPWIYANLAGAYCSFTGQCDDEGVEAAAAAIELDRRLGQLDHLAVPLIVLGQIEQCHGNMGIARQHYLEALELAERMNEPQLLFPCYDGLATVLLEEGRDTEAETFLQRGIEICEQHGINPDSLLTLPFLS